MTHEEEINELMAMSRAIREICRTGTMERGVQPHAVAVMLIGIGTSLARSIVKTYANDPELAGDVDTIRTSFLSLAERFADSMKAPHAKPADEPEVTLAAFRRATNDAERAKALGGVAIEGHPMATGDVMAVMVDANGDNTTLGRISRYAQKLKLHMLDEYRQNGAGAIGVPMAGILATCGFAQAMTEAVDKPEEYRAECLKVFRAYIDAFAAGQPIYGKAEDFRQ